jgi:hypothetical protein
MSFMEFKVNCVTCINVKAINVNSNKDNKLYFSNPGKGIDITCELP